MADWLSGGGGQNPQDALRQVILQRPFTENLALRKRLSRLEALEVLRENGQSPTIPMEFTSHFGEDCWLWDLFRGQRQGFFIEVGAFDGHTFSVSYPFEAFGWKGLLIEPIPEQYEKARQRRPGSRVVHAALGPPGSPGTCTFQVVEGGAEKSGMLSHSVASEATSRDIREVQARTRSVTVPQTTLNGLLAEHQGPIDFASIDVEGGEIDLLRGFDLAKFRPRVLIIEEGMPAQTSPVMQYMSRFSYSPASYVWINRVYIRNDERDLIARAQQIPM